MKMRRVESWKVTINNDPFQQNGSELFDSILRAKNNVIHSEKKSISCIPKFPIEQFNS